MTSNGCQSIADFYAGKSIFITSGTGFIGKVFLEKLLYSCRDVDKVYVLVREKDGKTAEERVNELVDNEVFYRIRNERPSTLNKVVPITGDIRYDNLGIKQKDEQFLEKVSVVFHIAASLKFNERLDLSLNANVEGTRRVLDLCRRMNRLQAYVHLSTAYTYPDRKVIEEIVYPPVAKMSDVYKFIEEHGVDDEGKIKKVLNGRPNTYTFTKALAETLVAEEELNIPAIIIRPSIVTSAMKEPAEGWIDSWMGASALILSTAKGFNRVLFGKKENRLDMIPVDYVTNFMIVAAATYDSTQKVTVYNCCTSSINPAKFGDIVLYINEYCSKSGFNDVPLVPFLFTTKPKIESLATFMLQKMPAFVADSWRSIKGKKPRYMKMQSQVIFHRNLLKYFTAASWEIKSDNVRNVYSSLSPQDQQTFPCDPALINWRHYIPLYLRGIKKYLLKK